MQPLLLVGVDGDAGRHVDRLARGAGGRRILEGGDRAGSNAVVVGSRVAVVDDPGIEQLEREPLVVAGGLGGGQEGRGGAIVARLQQVELVGEGIRRNAVHAVDAHHPAAFLVDASVAGTHQGAAAVMAVVLVARPPRVEARAVVGHVHAADLVVVVAAAGGALRALVVGQGPARRLRGECRSGRRVAIAVPVGRAGAGHCRIGVCVAAGATDHHGLDLGFRRSRAVAAQGAIGEDVVTRFGDAEIRSEQFGLGIGRGGAGPVHGRVAAQCQRNHAIGHAVGQGRVAADRLDRARNHRRAAARDQRPVARRQRGQGIFERNRLRVAAGVHPGHPDGDALEFVVVHPAGTGIAVVGIGRVAGVGTVGQELAVGGCGIAVGVLVVGIARHGPAAGVVDGADSARGIAAIGDALVGHRAAHPVEAAQLLDLVLGQRQGNGIRL